MSYTELEHGYQGLKKTRPAFYIGHETAEVLRSTTTKFNLRTCWHRDMKKARCFFSKEFWSDLSKKLFNKKPKNKAGKIKEPASMDFSINYSGSSSDGDEDASGKQVVVGICAMSKKSQSKPMREILTRLAEFQYIRILVFPEEVIVSKPVEEWPLCDCLISFHSKGFPLEKALQYSNLRHPYVINNLNMQYDIQDRRKVYAILESQGIEIPRYAVLDRDSTDPMQHELIESEDHVEVNGIVFNKPFVEKPVSAEDHNIYIYYPTSAGGGSQRLFRKIGSRSSVYSPESRVRKTGSYIYEDFMPTDGTDVKVYTVGPDYAHAEARKSPALDGKVERDSEGKEIRYPVILSNAEKLISRKVCLAFKQTVCGFDLLRANGKSFVCDVNGFSFVKNSNKYYDDCAKILGNMILRELAPTLHIPWSIPFQLDDPPIVPTTFGKMMELRCVVAVIRHGDRTPKQKMKVEVRHQKFFEIFEKYGGLTDGHVKLKRPKQLQEVLDIARFLLNEIEQRAAPELAEKQAKLEQLKSVLEMYGHFSGINRKVQMKYQPKGRPKSSSSDDDGPSEPSLVLIVKWGGELTPAGRVQAEELGRIFRCMYPGGQGRHYTGEYAGTQGLGLLRLHSTYRHDLKIYASDEGRVQMTAAAFAKGLLALEGELTPILVQMVKSANTNGLLDNDYDASKHQDIAKSRLHSLMQEDRDFSAEDRIAINPCNAISINLALDFVKNPVRACERVQDLIQKLVNIVKLKKDDPKTKDAVLYHGETWELMGRRWGKIEKDFCQKNKTYDISKIPDIYDCIKYDLQHNQHTLQFDQAEELYINAKYLADIVIPQEYGMTMLEKLTISQGICTPLLKKIRADLQRNIEETGEENVNRLNPWYSHGVSSPGRHVRTRLYFTSESHLHSLLTVLRYGGLINNGEENVSTSEMSISFFEDPRIKEPVKIPVVERVYNSRDEQWRRAMEYVSMVSEINYMSQIVILLYEDPTKDPSSEQRFHVELHFSPGVNCCVQKDLPPGPGFRPHSRNDQGNKSNHSISSPENSSVESPPSSPEIRKKQEGTNVISDPIPIRPKPTNHGTQDERQSLRQKKQLQTNPGVETKSKSYEQSVRQPTTTVGNPSRAVGKQKLDWELQNFDICSNTASFVNKQLIKLGSIPSRALGKTMNWDRQSYGIHSNTATFVNQQLNMLEIRRRQRHSVTGFRAQRPGAMTRVSPASGSSRDSPSFFLIGQHKTARSVFSTAVISGAASAPNLTDIIPNTASVSEGCGGVPPIRPLETLHNALSLKQIDSFLDRMARSFKTPASTPPKVPSSPRLSSPPGMGWSDPPSFVSSSEASSPTPLPEFFLAQRLGMNPITLSRRDHRDSMEVFKTVDNLMHFAPISPEEETVDCEGSGGVTPVSCGSDEIDVSSEMLEADSTVVPIDTVRARLSDICWNKPSPENKSEKAGISLSRFVCTSVSEPELLQIQTVHEPSLTLATSTPESTSIGFKIDGNEKM
ncbi:inositol hexakisphosphate and diphosphoinositol-pentakisphosphate kinase 2 isoform X5 [Cimex lectularius]|uniref:Inositol hexakisphosphate and diphosphoinositol-pentakisphosphate kinase n=1 Tax=Cimex lectularius TaxID=79782 RepID=A0A8I6RBQ4_CIMLE|nr:inositol hexakisphosphate and diphosphoinositol-pentakisphosphate kinase 2 isoform X5 [Cimex lectularius]